MSSPALFRPSKIQRVLSAIIALGFTENEARKLRQLSQQLRRIATDFCNGDLSRDESTGQVYRHYGRGTRGPFLTKKEPDREAIALEQIRAIMADRIARLIIDRILAEREGKTFEPSLEILPFYQRDPRGNALYLVKSTDLREGETLDCIYTRGLAV